MRRTIALLAVALAVLLAQTASSSAHQTSSPSTPKQPVPCGKAQAALLLTQFLSAFNSGNKQKLDRVIAKPNRFRWYSVGAMPGERIDPVAHDRASLLDYFAARHAAGEQLALVSATFLKKTRGFFDFTYALARTANDMSGPTPYGGKAALVCFAGPPAIAVWSMGPDAS